MDRDFKKALNRAEEIVSTWPAWKQTSLLVTAMSTTPQPREPGGVGAVDMGGSGSLRFQTGGDREVLSWSVLIVDGRVLGSDGSTGGTDTPKNHASVSKEFLEAVAEIDIQFVDESNGPGYYFCPACLEKLNVIWDWGRQVNSSWDIEHAQNCPIKIAKEMLGY